MSELLRVPQYVASLKPYVPGKPIEELERELGITGSVKLASNENPLGPSRAALYAINQGALDSLNRYPDGGGYYLKRRLSEMHGAGMDEIILGNGSNELLDIAVRTFMKHGDDAVMAWPSFVVYPMAVQACGCRGIKVPLGDFRHDLQGMLGSITENTKIVFIANPNNPTGTINTQRELDGFMDALPADVIVVVDEAYYEYVEDPSYAQSIKYFRDGRNIIILRTFSKIYGLAGLRIGYGIASADIVSEMDKIREPFNTSSIAQKAALAALSDEAHVEQSKSINNQGKKYLYKELDEMGMRYVPTEANFIYIFTPVDAEDVFNALLKEGVIVRPFGGEALRVTIGLPHENRRFIESFRKVLSNA